MIKSLVDKLKVYLIGQKLIFLQLVSRRVDEERLIYNQEVCGANRISFSVLDFDSSETL